VTVVGDRLSCNRNLRAERTADARSGRRAGGARPTYRPDIDGLRAVAVLSVLLFHAKLSGFSGGFVGVDVFFVISGYLITSIIAAELAVDQFCIAEFYARRVRRIFPALFTMTFVTGLVAGGFFLPVDFRAFGTSIVALATFSANILFWRQDGYFDEPAELKPLLHTWSLCIEEQFYLFFPLLLAVLWHLSPARRWRLLAGLGLLSFGLNLWITHKGSEAAFYILPPRAWELLLGVLLALRPDALLGFSPATRGAAGWCGLGMIAAAVVLFDKTTPFPGIAALLPTVGAVLVIAFGRGADNGSAGLRGIGIATLLASPPLVFVGRISFSLYLWHWPVLVLMRYALARDLAPAEIVVAIAISFFLAVLSWVYVEQPFRGARSIPSIFPLKVALATLAGFVLVGAGIVWTDGLPQRLSERLITYGQAVETEDTARTRCYSWKPAHTDLSDVCLIGDLSAARPTFAVIGDSHAEALLPAFEIASKRNREKGLVFIRHACRPALGVMNFDAGKLNAGCTRFVDKAIVEIRAETSIRKVIFSARWSRQVLGTGFLQPDTYYADKLSTVVSPTENKATLIRGLARAFEALSGRRIVIVGMVPENEFLPPMALAMADFFDRPLPQTSTAAFRRRNAPVEKVFAELSKKYVFDVVSPARLLCSETSCLAQIGGRPLYRDDDHLSAFGAEQLVRAIEEIFGDGPRSGIAAADRASK
jgi:peptidoglycan/LPS O-acetylase OafA/YrhL